MVKEGPRGGKTKGGPDGEGGMLVGRDREVETASEEGGSTTIGG